MRCNGDAEFDGDGRCDVCVCNEDVGCRGVEIWGVGCSGDVGCDKDVGYSMDVGCDGDMG